MKKGRATAAGLAVAAVAVAVVVNGASVADGTGAAPAGQGVGPAQARGLGRAVAAAMSVAAADNPFMTASKAERAANRASTEWPSNVSSVRMVPLPRSSALAQMGEPDAVVGDDQEMVLFQMVGEFSLRVYPHPPDVDGAPINSPVLLLAIDPDSGDTLDFSMRQEPVSLTGDVSVLLNRRTSRVSLDTDRSRSKLKVDVDPDRARRDYSLTIYRVRHGKWRVFKKLTTTGARDLGKVDAPKGTYRAISLPGAKLAGSSSGNVRLRK
ncbi:MAG: hypothetical protein U0904_10790 [Candidatus Nanopelagicales bacterium]|nr:hypothetical protein [Candidatus Nanopelagicales bacterium]